jgi:hypothetical protein
LAQFSGYDTKSITNRRINKLSYIKIKNFFGLNDKINRKERQFIEWEKILAYHISDKGHYPEYIENISNSTIKKKKNQPIYK